MIHSRVCGGLFGPYILRGTRQFRKVGGHVREVIKAFASIGAYLLRNIQYNTYVRWLFRLRFDALFETGYAA